MYKDMEVFSYLYFLLLCTLPVVLGCPLSVLEKPISPSRISRFIYFLWSKWL